MSAATGSPTQPAVRSSFPIEFRLEDNEGNNAIYITQDVAEDRHLVIVLTNRSGESIQLGPAGPHFELRFRNGVLSPTTLELLASGAGSKVLAAEPSWTVARQDYAEELALKFTWTKPKSAGADPVLAPGGSLSLALKHITADPNHGVYTTQVGFSPLQLVYGDGVLVTGFRTQRLHVLSHLGKPLIPLHVGLVDDKVDGVVARQTLLNDGATVNCLCLRITNLQSTQPLKLNSKDSETPTTLTLTIPTGEESQPWAMMSSDDAKKILPTTNNTGWEPLEKGDGKLGGGTAYVFKFVPSIRTTKLDQSFDILLTNVTTKAAAGQATLLVEYGNFPGYWSGRFDIPVHKGPLLFSGTNVGILTPDPTSPLSITSNTDAPTLYVKQAGAGRAAHFEGPVQISSPTLKTERAALNIETSEWHNAPALMARSKTLQAAGYFIGRVYIGSQGPDRLLQTPNSLYVEAFSAAAALNVRALQQDLQAARFWGGVTIEGGGVSIKGGVSIEGDVSITGKLAGHFVPNFVSEWTWDHSAEEHTTTIIHKLGYLPALVMLYFSPPLPGAHPLRPSGKVYPVGWTWDNTAVGNPVTVEVTTTEVVLHIAPYNVSGEGRLHGLFDTGTHPPSWTCHKTGYWRVVLFGSQE